MYPNCFSAHIERIVLMNRVRVKSKPRSGNEEPATSLKDVVSDNAQQLSVLSFELEEKREASLIAQSSQMLTCFSIFTAALLLLAPLIIEHVKQVPPKYTMICLGITMIILIASMILALLVQWRYKYRSLPSPLTIYNHMVEKNLDYFETPVQRNKSWIETMNDTWESKNKINGVRAKLVKASMIVFLSSIGFVLCSSIFACLAFVL